MFGNFSANVRQAMITANRVANEAGCDYIGTAHLLVGILGDAHGVATTALADLGIDVSAFRRRVEDFVRDDERPEPVETPTIPPRAKRAIELAISFQQSMADQQVDCDHLLLGLLQEGEGQAARLLGEYGVTITSLHAAVLRRRGR